MIHHSNNGLCFERLMGGRVEVTRRRRLLSVENEGQAGRAYVDVIDERWLLTASEWASVVASVSAEGETSETWQQALDLHGEPAPEPDVSS